MSRYLRTFPLLLLGGTLLLVGISCAQAVPKSSPDTLSQTIIQQAGIDLDMLEPDEVCVINATAEETKQLDQFATTRGYTKKKRRILDGLGVVMSIFKIPPGQTVYEGIAEFREAFPSLAIDANHRYHIQGIHRQIAPHHYGRQLVGWDEQALRCGTAPLNIGMIDTGIETNHPLLQHHLIQTQSFLSKDTRFAPQIHGTTVAIQLVGSSPSMTHGMLPNARLFVAETFRERSSQQVEATTWSIVRALDWLISEKIHVINMSLGGPNNALLSFAITHTLQQNISIIAAAGNLGPEGHAVFPAAQEGVIAVTALDAKLNPYLHANRGNYISLSAPGVDIWVPDGNGPGLFHSGTSYATPFVTTAAAILKQSHTQWTPNQVAQQLAKDALDLGKAGKDRVYGWGLVQIPKHC